MIGKSGIATPGFCDNAARCSEGASGRIVLVPLGTDFVCSDCGSVLRHPPHGTRPFPVGFIAAAVFILLCAGTGLGFGIGYGPNGLRQVKLFPVAGPPAPR